MSSQLSKFLKNSLRYLPFIILAFGIVLRVVMTLQARCLMIDEANIARNIYESDYLTLLNPLHYDQFAPPLFLWVLKLFTSMFGYSEWVFRLYPLICGIAALCLMYLLLEEYVDNTAIWYPLILMATGIIYLRYSTETKQYMPDAFIAILLSYLALKIDIQKTSLAKFIFIWLTCFSFAIWLSMPSVFIICGVGAYYLITALNQKLYRQAGALFIIGLVVAAQFLLYYTLILKPQIGLDYLQSFHKGGFLVLIPQTLQELESNWETSTKVIGNAAGFLGLPLGFHLLLITLAIVVLLKKHLAKGLLIIVPIAALFFAACLRQYALTPRLVLFIMPSILILIAVGLQQILSVKYIVVKVLTIIVAIICVIVFNQAKYLFQRFCVEQITESMEYIRKDGIKAPELMVVNCAEPAYLYYTTIHPAKEKWKDLAGAAILHWNSNYDSLLKVHSCHMGFLYTYEEQGVLSSQQDIIKKHCKEKGHFETEGSKAFIFE